MNPPIILSSARPISAPSVSLIWSWPLPNSNKIIDLFYDKTSGFSTAIKSEHPISLRISQQTAKFLDQIPTERIANVALHYFKNTFVSFSEQEDALEIKRLSWDKRAASKYLDNLIAKYQRSLTSSQYSYLLVRDFFFAAGGNFETSSSLQQELEAIQHSFQDHRNKLEEYKKFISKEAGQDEFKDLCSQGVLQEMLSVTENRIKDHQLILHVLKLSAAGLESKLIIFKENIQQELNELQPNELLAKLGEIMAVLEDLWRQARDYSEAASLFNVLQEKGTALQEANNIRRDEIYKRLQELIHRRTGINIEEVKEEKAKTLSRLYDSHKKNVEESEKIRNVEDYGRRILKKQEEFELRYRDALVAVITDQSKARKILALRENINKIFTEMKKWSEERQLSILEKLLSINLQGEDVEQKINQLAQF
ncbi:hypothetical protein [Neochlamydia sp. S13]|uniref:hypothetical protein n=1 Tax=Neochlamydia sp. S13 TaxID=1353976 RepID=UPI0005A75B8E|nr:hypothetical protein [Neochlamydia sp. S13]BBI17608.1 hypothetical protein NCS13_1_1413 [Neochlamydia sp. S13]